MNPQTLSLRALLFLGLWHAGRRGLASAPELQDQPKKIGKLSARLRPVTNQGPLLSATAASVRSDAVESFYFNFSNVFLEDG